MTKRFPAFIAFLAVYLVVSAGIGLAQTQKQPAAKPVANPVAKPVSSVPQPSLVSFSAGALIVQKPAEYDESWSAFWIIDERPQSGWATPEGVITPQVIVIALPEQTVLTNLIFDTGSTDGAKRGAKDITVEMSDTGPQSGFKTIGAVSIRDKVNNQAFPVETEVPGRWVRLTVKNNHGAPDYIELMDFRATGRQLTKTPVENISGTYETNYNDFHIRQEGTSLTGCYEYQEGVLSGGIEGRVLKFTWTEGQSHGPAIMVLSPDAKQLFGLWWHEGATNGHGGIWNGTKTSNEVGTCPHWSGGAAEDLTKDLETSGRARIYGINFDTDSAVIRSESKPTLERIATMLKSKADWQMTVEGHTDATGSAAYNQSLSEKRAQSVIDFLTAAGIPAARLKAAGFGSSKPVASNDTELGRGQNRRVELVKR